MKAMKLMPFALMVGANMQQAILFGAKLRNADMTIVNLFEINLEVSELMSADLPSPTLRTLVSLDVNLSGTTPSHPD